MSVSVHVFELKKNRFQLLSKHTKLNDGKGNVSKHKWTRAYHTAFVETEYGYLEGTDVDDAEEKARIWFYQVQAIIARQKNTP